MWSTALYLSFLKLTLWPSSCTLLTRNTEAKNLNGQPALVAFFAFILVSRFKQRVKTCFCNKFPHHQDFTTSTPNPEEMLDGTKTYPGPGQRNKGTDARVGYLYKLPPSGNQKT